MGPIVGHAYVIERIDLTDYDYELIKEIENIVKTRQAEIRKKKEKESENARH